MESEMIQGLPPIEKGDNLELGEISSEESIQMEHPKVDLFPQKLKNSVQEYEEGEEGNQYNKDSDEDDQSSKNKIANLPNPKKYQLNISSKPKTQKFLNNTKKIRKSPNMYSSHKSKLFQRTEVSRIKKETLTENLTIEEGEKLLKVWREGHFIQFNQWLQISKATLITDYVCNSNIENSNAQANNNPSAGYSSSLQLKFNTIRHGKINDFVSVGYGKSKKQARLIATEHMVIDLIQTGLIKLGLRDKKFNQEFKDIENKNFNDYTLKVLDPHGESAKIEKQKKVHKFSRRIQESLKSDNFDEALLLLQQILALKKPDWNEINSLWGYALAKLDIEKLTRIIEVVAKKKYMGSSVILNSTQQTGITSKDASTIVKESKDFVRKYEEDKVRQKLFSIYGFSRGHLENNYEVFDSYTLEINENDIMTNYTQILNEEDQERELVKDPFSHDMNELFVQPTVDTLKSDVSPIKSIYEKNPKWPHTAIDPFLLDHEEKLHCQKLNFDDDEIEDENVPGDEAMGKRIFRNLTNATLNNPAVLRGLKDICEGNDMQNINASKQPYITRELLNNFYETLLYSGDLSLSLSMVERIYSQLQLDPAQFLNAHCTEYYHHSKNLQLVELLDQIYQVFNGGCNSISTSNSGSSNMKAKSNPDYLCNLHGTLERIGTCHNIDVLLLLPTDRSDILDNKIMKRCKVDVKDTSHHIVEGDIVILTSFFQPSYDKPILKEQTSALANYINVKSKNSKDNQHFIQSITEFGNIVEYAMVASVKEITKEGKLKMFVLGTQLHLKAVTNNPGRIWKITKLTSRTRHERQEEALIEFCTNNKSMNTSIFHILLTPPSQSSFLIKKLCETKTENYGVKTKTNLNNNQDIAVKTACSQLITLIQGPPGCGKTTTSVEIVIEWLRQSGQSILVTSESQQNVDILYNEMTKAGIKVVRLGPGFEDKFNIMQNSDMYNQGNKSNTIISGAGSQMYNNMPNQSFNNQQPQQQQQQQQQMNTSSNHSTNNAPGYSQLNNARKPERSIQDFSNLNKINYNQNQDSLLYTYKPVPLAMKFMYLKKQIREASVVCCKCDAAASDYLKSLNFQRILIDDAHKVNENLALVPLVKNCQQLVLIGDYLMQQPKCDSYMAQSKGACLSLFEKLIRQGVKPLFLNTQYKIHPSLIEFPAKYFYREQIENGITDEERPRIHGFNWPNPSIRNALIFVKGLEWLSNGGLQNPKEIEVIMEVVMQTLRAGYVKASDIGIITTFEEQKRRLKTEIIYQVKKHPNLFGLTIEDAYKVTKHSQFIDVESIDKSYLLEKELIIFSPVRSNKYNGLGILKDPRRLNTILWSGKRGLIVIGDIETLSSDGNWSEYIRWAKNNKLILYYCK